MSNAVPGTLRARVRKRAAQKCEYCLLHEEDSFYTHELDHIIAVKHRGRTLALNLALACYSCNRLKGSDIASIDIETGKLVRLFNPRTDDWQVHFRLQGFVIVPLTPEARVTEYLLQFNSPENAAIRQLLIRAKRYPR